MLINNELEVFVLTHNRLNYLKETLNSLLTQTVNNIRITVVDNASNDGTQEYINELKKIHANLSYYRHPYNIGVLKNFLSVQKMVSAKYVYIPHDDDIIHPQYIETVLEVIKKEGDVDLICCQKTDFTNSCNINIKNKSKIKYLIYNSEDFKACAFIHKNRRSIVFPSVIYNASNFKNVIFDKLALNSGAIGDIACVIDTLENRKCILVDESMLFYRNHKEQDSATRKIYASEIISFNKFFKKKLCKTLYQRLIFNVFSYYWFIKTINFYGCYDALSLLDILKTQNSLR